VIPLWHLTRHGCETKSVNDPLRHQRNIQEPL
jgi:hypothetical protein